MFQSMAKRDQDVRRLHSYLPYLHTEIARGHKQQGSQPLRENDFYFFQIGKTQGIDKKSHHQGGQTQVI